MKTVIEMAREAGFVEDMPIIRLERFAALVREDEREKQQAIADSGSEVSLETNTHEPVAWIEMEDDPIFLKRSLTFDAPGSPGSYQNPEIELIYITLYTIPRTAALASRQMRDAAVKVCKNFAERDMHPAECAGAIERLPVPEVKWRDLTDEEIWNMWDDNETNLEFGEAVIAKFKEKNK